MVYHSDVGYLHLSWEANISQFIEKNKITVSHDKGENIFFPPFIKEKNAKAPNITTNNERKTNKAIPFHGGGAE